MAAKPVDKTPAEIDPEGIFGTPQKIFNICENMQLAEDQRAKDRAKINTLFNGSNPYSKDEEERFQIQINVNWGFGKSIIRDANTQLNTAFLQTGQLFTCACQGGKTSKRDDWSTYFTKNVHVPIQSGKGGRRHYFLMKERNASICLHGIGTFLWPNDFKWIPRYVPLEDLLIPTDTYCDLSNLRYFGVNLYLSPGEFAEMALGKNVLKGWNQEQVKAILDSQKSQVLDANLTSTWKDQPEATAEIFKQNRGFYYCDAVPTIKLRAFYFEEVDNPGTWYRHIILRENVQGADPNVFVFDGSDAPFSTDINRILNIQYGDGNFVAPFKYHSVRGIGIDLFAPVEALNRIQCQTVQHTLESLQMLFKIQDPADKARLKSFVLEQFGYIPEGLTIVPRQDRHQIDPQIVELSMGLIRQNMQESSSGFVQNVNDGSQKQMTAKEVTARLNQANVMVSGMLQSLDLQQGFYWQEVVRRFCDKKSEDKDVQKFQKQCVKDGIPEDLLYDADNWKVTTNRVLGGGDKTLAQVQSMWLFQNRTAFSPQSQQKILRLTTTTMLDDPAKGADLVPQLPITATVGALAAEDVFGTLMTGNSVELRSGIDEQGYIQTLLKLMDNVVVRIAKTDNMGTMQDLIGLQSVAMNIQEHIKILEADPQQQQLVKMFGDALGKVQNLVKSFAQRQQQMMKAKSGGAAEKVVIDYKDAPPDVKRQMEGAAGFQPSRMPDGDPKTAKAIQGLQIKDAQFKQKQRQTEIAFQMEQIRLNTEAKNNLTQQEQVHRQEMVHAAAEKIMQLMTTQQQTENKGESAPKE
jgi:hypothetical protein